MSMGATSGLSGDSAPLRTRGNAWRRDARQVEFLCELALDEAELAQWFELAREDLRSGGGLGVASDVAFALAVLAVNDYYYCEQSDSGFRERFTQSLFARADVQTWNDLLGPLIERAIVGWSGQPVREGPYRWVGLIREHSGIALRDLPRLAKLMRRLDEAGGWARLFEASSDQLIEHVRAIFNTTAVGNYLASKEGLARLRAIGRDLTRWRDGLIGEERLRDLPGYRPDFLPELLRLLSEPPPSAPPGAASAPPPEMRLDLELFRLALRFDQEDVLSRRVRCDQITANGGRPWRSVAPLGCGEDPLSFARHFSGEIQRAGEWMRWEAAGWLPRPGGWAIFDGDGGFLCCSDRPAAVSPGDYLLISETTPEEFYHDLGTLELGPDYVDLDLGIFEVGLSADTASVPGLPVKAAIHPEPRLEPIGAVAWSRFTEVDGVWTDASPMIRLHNWDAVNRRRHLILYKTALGVEQIDPPPDKTDTVELALGDVGMPGLGQVWLEAVGHQREHVGVKHRLTLARWPDVRVDPPKGLFGEHERPRLNLELPPDVVAKPADGAEGDPNHGSLRASAGASLSEVDLSYHEQKLRLRLPVHRARLHFATGPAEPLLLDSDRLGELEAPLVGDERVRRLTLCVLPGVAVDLLLVDEVGEVHELTRSLPPVHTGRIVLPVSEISDGLRNSGCALGRFVVRQRGRQTPTEAWYLNPEALAQHAMNEKATLPDAPPSIAAGLGLLTAIREGRPPETSRVPPRPEGWRALIARWWTAAEVFEDWPAPPWHIEEDPPVSLRPLAEVRVLLEEARESGRFVAAPDEAQRWLDQWDRLHVSDLLRKHGLGLPRWLIRIEREREWMAGRAAVMDRLTAWRARVRDESSEPRDVPHALLSVAQRYHKGLGNPKRQQEYLSQAAAILNKQRLGLEGLWHGIGTILLPLIYLRLGEVKGFLSFLDQEHDARYCRSALDQLRWIAAVLRMRPPHELRHPRDRGFGPVSPRDDDQRLSAAIADGQQWGTAAERDWLAAWLGWRWHVMSGGASEAATLRERLSQHRMHIPKTRDASYILQEIDKWKPRMW